MGNKRKIKRYIQNGVIKARIDELLVLLDMSRNQWKKLDVKVEGKGLEAKIAQKYFKPTNKLKWGRHKKGKKPSLKEQYAVLWDLWETQIKNQKEMTEIKKQMDKMSPKEEVEK